MTGLGHGRSGHGARVGYGKVGVMSLSDVMEFDHVIVVGEDGSVSDAPNLRRFWVPDVAYVNDDCSVDMYPEWRALNGFSGQWCYGGPVMHPSEFIGGVMEDHILGTPGVYVAVLVYDRDDDETEDGWEPYGWAVLEYVGE